MRLRIMLAIVCMLLSGQPLAAEFSGQFDLGFREVDVSGDEAKYKQQVNLDSGPRLFGLNLTFEPATTTPHAPDRIELSARGLGGDPYQNVRAELRKYGAYRFIYQRRQSDYFYQDLLIDPDDIDLENVNGGDFRTFDFRRVQDKVGLDIQMTDRASLNFGFDRYEKTGDSTIPLDVEREEFEFEAPVDEVLENVDVGFEYAWSKVTFTLNQRWRDFTNDVSAFLPGASEGADPGEPTRLDFFFLDQPYSYDSRETQLSAVARPTDRWDIKADVFFADLEMQFEAEENSQGLDFLGNPFQRSISGDGGADRDTRQLFLSSSYAVTDSVRITASVRDQQLEQEAELLFGAADGLSDWRMDTSGASLGVEATLFSDWTFGGGWSGQRRTTRYSQASVDQQRDADIKTTRDGFYAILTHRPSRHWNISLSAENNGIDDPFTLASPTDTKRYRVRARYVWDNGLNLSASYLHRENINKSSGWKSKSRQTDARLTFTRKVLTVSVGGSLVDLDRGIDQLVTGGFRQDLFLISYDADSSFWDATANWHVLSWLDLIGSYRDYSNDGSFAVAHRDGRLAASLLLPGNYRFEAGYRNVDFEEGNLEAFDADIWQLSVKYHW